MKVVKKKKAKQVKKLAEKSETETQATVGKSTSVPPEQKKTKK